MKNSIKKFSVLFLSFAFILCTLALTVFGFNSAKADVVAEFSVYQMEESVSIKQVENGGIRFRVKMDANTKALIDSADDVTYGFIITPVYFYENRAADTAETPAYGVDDYISSIAKYAGETGVGILGDKAKIYQENEGDEFYYANGVLEGIGNDSPDLKYIAIAYVKDGSGFHYATFDANDAIDIKTAASKIYLQEKSDIETIRKIDILDDFGMETNPVLISDNADMYALSSATNSGVITGEEDAGTGVEETINFKLANDVTIDCDFEQIATEKFNGAFIESDKKVNIINGGTSLTRVFADEAEQEASGLTCANVVTGITVTDKVSNRMTAYNAQESVQAMLPGTSSFVANEDLPYNDGYAGNAIKYSGGSGVAFQVKLNYTKEELAELDYNRVRFNIMVVGDNYSTINHDYEGLFYHSAHFLYGSATYFNHIQLNKWHSYDLSMDQLIASMGLIEGYEDSAVIYRQYQGPGASGVSLYFGDMTFYNQTDESSLLKASEEFTSRGLIVSGSNTNTTVMSTYVSAEQLVSEEGVIANGYTGGALKFTGGTRYRLQLNYTEAELQAFLDAGTYDSVRIYIAGNAGQRASSGLWYTLGTKKWGAIDPVKQGWQEHTLTLEAFIALMKEVNGVTSIYIAEVGSASHVFYIGDMTLFKSEATA